MRGVIIFIAGRCIYGLLGCRLVFRGSAEGGVGVLVREAFSQCTQPRDRALEMPLRYFPKVQTPSLRGVCPILTIFSAPVAQAK